MGTINQTTAQINAELTGLGGSAYASLSALNAAYVAGTLLPGIYQIGNLDISYAGGTNLTGSGLYSGATALALLYADKASGFLPVGTYQVNQSTANTCDISVVWDGTDLSTVGGYFDTYAGMNAAQAAGTLPDGKYTARDSGVDYTCANGVLYPSGVFLQVGQGSVNRSYKDKNSERISVKDYGAIGDGTLHTVAEWIIPGALGRYANLAALQVDYPHVTSTANSIDWAATQAAINNNPGRLIYHPAGRYVNSTTLTINTDGTTLQGECVGLWWDTAGHGGSVVVCNAAVDAIHYVNPTSPTGAIHSCGLFDISIVRTQNVSSGAGLVIEDIANFECFNVRIEEFYYCIKSLGSLSPTFSNVRLYTGNAFTGGVGSALVYIAGVGDGGVVNNADAGYILSFNQCIMTSNKASDFIFNVISGDDLRINNSYLGLSKYALLKIQQLANVPNHAIEISNSYLDGAIMNGNGTLYGVWVATDGVTHTPAMVDLKITGGVIGQLDYAVYMDEPDIKTVNINGAHIHNIRKNTIYSSGQINTSIGVNGNTFLNCAYDATVAHSIIKVNGADSVNINGNTFKEVLATVDSVIELAGTIDVVAVNGNTIHSGGLDILDLKTSALTSNNVIAIGNSSDSLHSNINGLPFGQLKFPATQNPSSDANTLDDYEEGVFTPSVFATGGVATYVTQVGKYTKIGNQVSCAFTVEISAHTGSGAMVITGLPFTSANIADVVAACSFSLVANLTIPANSVLIGSVPVNASYISLYSMPNGGNLTLTALPVDTAFKLSGSVTYFTA